MTWNRHLEIGIKSLMKLVLVFKFIVNESDKCVYYKVRGNESIVLCLYVDDIFLFGTNIDIINEIKKFLERALWNEGYGWC